MGKKRTTLSPGERAVAQMVASMRYVCSRAAGVFNAKMGSQPDWKTDLEGFAAEMAFGKMYNLYPDFSAAPRKGGWDFTSRAGARIDVKVTHHDDGKLLATLKKRIDDADVYVLLIGKFPTYEAIGYATAEELLRDENIGDLGHGPGYILTQKKLKKL